MLNKKMKIFISNTVQISFQNQASWFYSATKICDDRLEISGINKLLKLYVDFMHLSRACDGKALLHAKLIARS